MKTREEYHVSGEELITLIKKLIHEGNIRKIIVRNESGHVIMEIPLTFGVVGAVFAPVLAAVGAIAALAVKYRIEVVRKEED